MCSLLQLVDTVISLYVWALIIAVIMTWLVQFNVINGRNRVVYLIGDFLTRITEPALMPIRRVLPDLGGIDISPVVLILLLTFGQSLLWEMFGGACMTRL
ncbi:MAG: YggT family protein [Alphaproteobacteria bacterium]|jgi:YggT family protein|nr:YggT family protein [Alphaproteobacteria bacterium]